MHRSSGRGSHCGLRGGGEKNGQRKRHTVRDVTKCGVNPGRGFQQYQAVIKDDYRRASLEILNPGKREYARLILLENASHRLMMDLSHPDFLRCGSWAHGCMHARGTSLELCAWDGVELGYSPVLQGVL